MIKTTGAIDRVIATAAGITAHAKIHPAGDVVRMAGRQVASVRAAAKRGLVEIIKEWNDGSRNQISFELTEVGLERALELEELYADPKTGIIPMMTLINL